MFAVRLLVAACLVLAGMLGISARAFAETASTVVDMSSLGAQLVQVLGAALLAAGLWLIRLLQAKLKLDADAAVRVYLETALRNGIAYGVVRAEERMRSSGAAAIDFRSDVVAVAAQYVNDKVPDALKRFGIDIDHLDEMILARLPDVRAAEAKAP